MSNSYCLVSNFIKQVKTLEKILITPNIVKGIYIPIDPIYTPIHGIINYPSPLKALAKPKPLALIIVGYNSPVY